MNILLGIIVKYDAPIREWGGLYYALLEVSMNKIALWKNVHVEDWTAELAIIASNDTLEMATHNHCFYITLFSSYMYVRSVNNNTPDFLFSFFFCFIFYPKDFVDTPPLGGDITNTLSISNHEQRRKRTTKTNWF